MTGAAPIYLSKVDGATPPNTLLKYFVSNLDSVNINYNVGSTQTPLPQNPAQAAIIVKATGNLNSITIKWLIKERSDQLVTGSLINAIVVKTLGQQLGFFDTLFQATSVDDKYKFEIDYPDVPYVQYGLVTDMQFILNGSTPNAIDAQITFIVGNVVTVYQADVPSDPNNFSASRSGTTANLSWTAPTYIPSGHPVTDYIIERQDNIGGFVVINTVNGSTFSYADAGLSSGTYYYRVSARNDNGTGLPTKTLTVVIP